MQLTERIRRIREIRGRKQTWVAEQIGITQQAYSCLEQGNGNAKVNTLQRFCEVMQVQLSYLLSDLRITHETIEQLGNKPLSELAKQKAGGPVVNIGSLFNHLLILETPPSQREDLVKEIGMILTKAVASANVECQLP